jgi:hypothetical protein
MPPMSDSQAQTFGTFSNTEENLILSRGTSFKTADLPRDSVETVSLPPDLRNEISSESIEKPILILDINIGGPNKDIVPLEIYENQNAEDLVKQFSGKYSLSENKQIKLT